MATSHATSIFEYLTAKNPNLVYEEEKNATQTNGTWIRPKYVRPWAEFSFETMEKVFDGKLMQECRRERVLTYPAPPLIPEIDCIENGEQATVRILERWTRGMVNEALKQVVGTFYPVFWASRATSKKKASDAALSETSSLVDATPAGGTRRPRRASQLRLTLSKSKRRQPRPDGACIPLEADPLVVTGNKNTNQLPCEIKPGSKWTSESLLAGDLTEADGKLRTKKHTQNQARPIIQLYHYCVVAKARYGFLITSKEIVLIRIKPAAASGTPPREASPANATALHQELRYNGLMEYKAIPWANHWSRLDGQEDGDYRNLTINLSLWILCVLAGNSGDPDWDYQPLNKEMLREKMQAVEESKNDDDYEAATEPTQSAMSSFCFSEPAQSFSASFSHLSEKMQVRVPFPPSLVYHVCYTIPVLTSTFTGLPTATLLYHGGKGGR
ncbi:hypothetical protein B0H63DRAFT_476572 [Podospora didyma]|uniref:Uncharacterized protein n=1 Tax=Podospora didyma TaxID=330526 RepID=A0AAE0TW42_9PEZI|nr:hypothetical protein B0H63DRAFT_476572 [Podospora didyma]